MRYWPETRGESRPRTWVEFKDVFWRRYDPIPFSGCWIWMGAVTRSGYGVVTFDEITHSR